MVGLILMLAKQVAHSSRPGTLSFVPPDTLQGMHEVAAGVLLAQLESHGGPDSKIEHVFFGVGWGHFTRLYRIILFWTKSGG